jgi:hypothetical protein
VRGEIKRVLVARRQHPTVNSIARATGLPRFAVRTRLRLGRLLGRDSFRQVPEPARPWSAVEQDRQAAFITQDSGERQAARDLGVSRAELRRMLRRVRGLAGRC